MITVDWFFLCSRCIVWDCFFFSKIRKKMPFPNHIILCLPDEYFPVLVFWSVTKEWFRYWGKQNDLDTHQRTRPQGQRGLGNSYIFGLLHSFINSVSSLVSLITAFHTMNNWGFFVKLKFNYKMIFKMYFQEVFVSNPRLHLGLKTWHFSYNWYF